MIFIDTSFVYALADNDDLNHEDAVKLFSSVLQANEEIVTHNYVLVECAALLQRRLSMDIALTFLEDARSFRLIWVDEELHGQAVEELRRQNLSRLSMVDVLSFLAMRREGIRRFLGFDKHFEEAGFERYA